MQRLHYPRVMAESTTTHGRDWSTVVEPLLTHQHGWKRQRVAITGTSPPPARLTFELGTLTYTVAFGMPIVDNHLHQRD
jgi:hypothetical protein